MINSRDKGKRGELEFAHYLRDNFNVEARRGQQFKGGADSPDVISDLPIHFEVKRVEKLNIDKSMCQAENDCGDRLPVVAHRRNRAPWLLTIRAIEMVDFAKAIIHHCEVKDD